MLKKTLYPPIFFWNSTPSSTPELSPTSSSSESDSDGDMDPSGSRAPSLAVRTGAYCPMRPSLADVLSNTAPPPYTLSSFMAYLSQNHCLETLEFTLEANRYRESYNSLATRLNQDPITTGCPETSHLQMLWQRLLAAYIAPGSPREINLPSDVRDALLGMATLPSPPSPTTLDHAVKLIHELMEESIFLPFLNSHSTPPPAIPVSDAFGSPVASPTDESISVVSSPGLEDHATSSPRKGKRTSPQSSTPDLPGTNSFGRSSFAISAIATTLGKTGRSEPSSTSADTTSGTLTDDSGSLKSIVSAGEPMTPPMTPPSSEPSTYSPKNRPENPWKKMGLKLGFKKRSGNGNSIPRELE